MESLLQTYAHQGKMNRIAQTSPEKEVQPSTLDKLDVQSLDKENTEKQENFHRTLTTSLCSRTEFS